MIICIWEYIILFTQRLLATLCAYRQNDLKGKLFFQCVIRSVALEKHQCNYYAGRLSWCGESL